MTGRRVIVVVAAALVASCQLLLDLHRLTPDPEKPDAQQAVDPCAHALPPPPPAADDDPNITVDYWMATQEIRSPLPVVGGVKPGIDLDQSCTCAKDLHDGGPSCRTPGKDPVSCDFDGGVDDAFGALAESYTPFLQGHDFATSINSEVAEGGKTFLVYLANYNGKANDSDVGISLVSASGIYDDSPCGSAGLGKLAPEAHEGHQHPPRWDSCDRWSPFPGKFSGKAPERKTTVTKAYVTNYTLVAKVQQISADFVGSSFTLTDATAIGTLKREGAGFRMDGTISSRISFADAVLLVGTLDYSQPDGGRAPLCVSPFWDSTISKQLCAARDIMLQPSQDRQPNVECDAVTFVIGFSARPAIVADDEYMSPPRTIQCDAQVPCD